MGDNVFLRTNGPIGGSADDAEVDTFLRMNTNRTNTPTLRLQRIRTLTPTELRVAHGDS